MKKNGNSGKFYGVGVGPGDPQLMTLKALSVLKEVPVVFVPISRPGKDSYALKIVKGNHDFSKQKLVELLFPMKKDQGELVPYWERAVETILETVRQGLDSAFITEGDPFFFSTFIYVYTRIMEKIPMEKIEIIPGVPSFSASAAAAGFPIAHGDSRIAILPSAYDLSDIEDVLNRFETVVFMKISNALPQLLEKIEKLGLGDNMVYVEKCGATGEKIVRDPVEMKMLDPHYLSLMIVRKSR